MSNEPIQFLTQEYRALWRELGVEDSLLERLTQSDKGKPLLKARKTGVPAPVRGQPMGSTDLTLEAIRATMGDCTRCKLCEGRKNIVFGAGAPQSQLMFVGEGPGADEDIQGLPFVGRAGQLLDKIIEAMGYRRDDVYIANIVKCRPPENRAPEADETAQCIGFLFNQIEVIQPKLLVALGSSAATALLGSTSAISNLRGRLHAYPRNPKISIMPTYHPAYLLRNPAAKKLVWEDMKLVKNLLESKS